MRTALEHATGSMAQVSTPIPPDPVNRSAEHPAHPAVPGHSARVSKSFQLLSSGSCSSPIIRLIQRFTTSISSLFAPARADLSPLALSVAAVSPETVVIAASAHAGARVAKALRESGFGGAIFGGPWFGRASFAGQSGAPAEGALFSWVGEPVADFSRRFAVRFGGRPDYAAACAYDSVRIVIAAIREAGLNRARIRDALAKLSPYEGASGRIEWDEFGQNRRPPVLGIIRNGQPVPAPGEPGGFAPRQP